MLFAANMFMTSFLIGSWISILQSNGSSSCRSGQPCQLTAPGLSAFYSSSDGGTCPARLSGSGSSSTAGVKSEQVVGGGFMHASMKEIARMEDWKKVLYSGLHERPFRDEEEVRTPHGVHQGAGSALGGEGRRVGCSVSSRGSASFLNANPPWGLLGRKITATPPNVR